MPPNVKHTGRNIRLRVNDGYKICSRCDANKPVSEYCANKMGNNGLNARCRKCMSEIMKNPKYKETIKKWLKSERGRMILKKIRDSASYKKRAYLYRKKKRKNLHPFYVRQLIYLSTGIRPKTLHKYPELVESWKQQLMCKRLLKTKKKKSNGKKIPKTK